MKLPLKQIYTSGDSYTVLQLLQKLIEEVETFDTGMPLYLHSFVISGHYVDIVSYSKTACETFADIVKCVENSVIRNFDFTPILACGELGTHDLKIVTCSVTVVELVGTTISRGTTFIDKVTIYEGTI